MSPRVVRKASASFAVRPLRFREMDQHEIGDARRHLETELADLRRQPGEPARIVLARALLMRDVLDRGDAGGDRRRRDVERTADAVEGVDDMRRVRTSSRAAAPPGRRSSRRCGTSRRSREVATSSMPAS